MTERNEATKRGVSIHTPDRGIISYIQDMYHPVTTEETIIFSEPAPYDNNPLRIESENLGASNFESNLIAEQNTKGGDSDVRTIRATFPS